MDQARQDGMGYKLVEERPPEGGREPRHEQRNREVLHRLRRAEQLRVHADGRPLVGAQARACRSGRVWPRRQPRGSYQIRPGHRCADAGRVCEGEERPHLVDHPLPGHQRPDRRSLLAVRKMGRRRREDRLHRPHGPMGRELVPDGCEESRRTPPDARLPRSGQARRKCAHLPQCVDARRRHGRRVQPLERASHSQARRDARLHPHAGGADGLHARRAQQRDPGEFRAAPHRPW